MVKIFLNLFIFNILQYTLKHMETIHGKSLQNYEKKQQIVKSFLRLPSFLLPSPHSGLEPESASRVGLTRMSPERRGGLRVMLRRAQQPPAMRGIQNRLSVAYELTSQICPACNSSMGKIKSQFFPHTMFRFSILNLENFFGSK